MWYATWRCCCVPPCWTIWAWCPPCNGRRARFPNAPAWPSRWTLRAWPTICPKRSRPGSIAWCRERAAGVDRARRRSGLRQHAPARPRPAGHGRTCHASGRRVPLEVRAWTWHPIAHRNPVSRARYGGHRVNPVRILLADDHTVMRNGLRLLLERQPNLQVVGEAADGRQAVALSESANPDVVIMD